MIRWNWKLDLVKEAVAHWQLWVPEWDDPFDTIHQLTQRLHHMLCKARIIRRAHG